MVEHEDEAKFTFSWMALKLLGRGLYSNPWSALSELVANGLDAGADNVYVYIDARDNSNATVEVIDDGSGMSRLDIDTYVRVGHNKRANVDPTSTVGADEFKGRKGIGKLAALFLSQHFFLQTKHADNSSSWELDARKGRVEDDEFPRLIANSESPQTLNDQRWAAQQHGTRITLLNVNLSGYGLKSITGLGSRLANQFLLRGGSGPRIQMCVKLAGTSSEPVYSEVEKTIAFSNFAELAQSFKGDEIQPPELAATLPTVKIPAKGLLNGYYEHQPTPIPFPRDPAEDDAWAEIERFVDTHRQTYMDVPYRLSGWIGLHASIDMKTAKANDSRFEKNKYYNPAQLRVYVRGKLASDRLLTQLGITGTYVNYIEGEISFDLLDDNALPDIATSNRQDFDETDGRITLLRALVRPIVQGLIKRRNDLAGRVAEIVNEEKGRQDSLGKKHFSEQLNIDLMSHPEIPNAVREDLHSVITNKIQGEVTPKKIYRVFISHASADETFASLIDEVLRSRGATAEEIFYTSRSGAVENSLSDRALESIIKSSIVDANTLLFYMTSKNFLNSQYCLFEGGAGWATRAVSDYLKLNIDYSSIPKFLTNGKSEVTLRDAANRIELRPDVHNYLIRGIFNPMIEHLNRGREIMGRDRIEMFDVTPLPSKIEMQRLGRVASDYYDTTIREHWEFLVEQEVEEYLRAYDEVSS